jgi:hypothetical protein
MNAVYYTPHSHAEPPRQFVSKKCNTSRNASGFEENNVNLGCQEINGLAAGYDTGFRLLQKRIRVGKKEKGLK